MKKVLICYHSSQFGGVEKHILDIIAGLSKSFEIYIACPEGPLVESYLKAGAVKHFNISPKFEADFSYVGAVKKIISENNIDIIHSHELRTGSLATFAGLLAGCKKRIYHVHTSFTQWRYPSFKKYPALIINTIVNFIVGNFFATDVIALTESVAEIRNQKEFIFKGKIRVIPNGVDLNQFKFDEAGRREIRARYNITDDHFVVGNISRFSNEKGQELLIEAFKEFSDATLLLAGDGALKSAVEIKVREDSLDSRVHFLGSFHEPEKNKILSAFDLFAFPTYAEGFGIVLLEAMAVGIPSLASDLDVLRDVGSDAVEYFKTGDSSDLTNKLKELKDNREKLHQMSEKGMIKSKDYSLDKFWQAYINLYNSVA